MKRVAVLIAVFAAVIAILNLIACPIPYTAARAFDSPVATLQLTPPFRATPTGWPNAPFPTVAPRVRHEKEQPETDAVPIGLLYWRWLIFR